MPDHYFTQSPQSAHNPDSVHTQYRGHALEFETDSGVFSRTALDRGTEILLETLPEHIRGSVLDMGCGYGALGVSLAKANPECALTMVDINERAVSLASQNARRNGVASETLQSDGYVALAGRTFDLIVTNPPIRAGKRVIYQMFADGARTLGESGALYLVVRKQQGAPSAKAYLETLFARVDIVNREAGYWIMRCSAPMSCVWEGTPKPQEKATQSDAV